MAGAAADLPICGCLVDPSRFALREFQRRGEAERRRMSQQAQNVQHIARARADLTISTYGPSQSTTKRNQSSRGSRREKRLSRLLILSATIHPSTFGDLTLLFSFYNCKSIKREELSVFATFFLFPFFFQRIRWSRFFLVRNRTSVSCDSSRIVATVRASSDYCGSVPLRARARRSFDADHLYSARLNRTLLSFAL